MMRIIQHRGIGFAISGIAIVISIVALFMWGLKPGLDFTGGSLLEVEFAGVNRPEPADVVAAAKTVITNGEISAQPIGAAGMTVRTVTIDEAAHQMLVTKIRGTFAKGGGSVTENRFDSIGPVIGQELQQKTLWAVAIAILAIVLYITFVFRKVSYPVASWKYGVCTIVALGHDVVIPLGALAILGHYTGLEVGAWVVTALLTILGFSVHDTIVVFDRIRENLSKHGRDGFEDLVNRSINETLARSINTSLTVLLTLLAAYIFGGGSVKDFILTLLIGIFAGTYSSIFVASPLLVAWHVYVNKKR
jgi:preprotein translocase subunit SecF